MASSLLLHPPPLLTPTLRSSHHLLKPSCSSCTYSLSLPRFPSLTLSQSQSNRRALGFLLRAVENGGSGGGGGGGGEGISGEAAEAEARANSTLPDRFRYLTKEAPDPPVRWPWAIALVFLVYCWRAVLLELTNWKKAALGILSFLGYLLKLALALIYHFIGDPITGSIRCIEFSLYSVRYIYASIVAFAPVPELTRIILFASTILAIAESTVPDSVNSQPYLLTLAGVLSFAAIKGYVIEPFFYLFLFAMFSYSRFVKKRDIVSAVLPSAAAMAAIGEPWVRAVAIASYLAIAIVQHSKSSDKAADVSVKHRRPPLPLLLSAFAIGIHVAAKWVRYRHLTWMIA